MSMMPSPRERNRQVIENFQKVPYFPEKAGSWEDFIRPYQKVGKKTPFAITLQKVPDSHVCEIFLPRGEIPKDVFFGILTERNDSGLGELCFGGLSQDFGGAQSRQAAIFTKDEGFDAEFLRVPSSKSGLGFPFVPHRAYKITDMNSKFESVMSKLLGWASREVGADEPRSPKDLPNEVLASDLAKLRKYLKRLLTECGDDERKQKFESVFLRIGQHLELRIKMLEATKDDYKQKILDADRELCLLGD